MFQAGLSYYVGLTSGRSVSINVNRTRKHFSRNIHGARMFLRMFPSFPYEKHCFHGQFLFSTCKLCFSYTAGNFNENPSMRALAKILRARASEHLSNFCEQFEQRPNFASTLYSAANDPRPQMIPRSEMIPDEEWHGVWLPGFFFFCFLLYFYILLFIY